MTTSSGTGESRGDVVAVLYVERRNAKTAKTWLEQNDMLNKDFRMTPLDKSTCQLVDDNISMEDIENCIAIPVVTCDSLVLSDHQVYKDTVAATGTQFCPYSSAMLGNHRLIPQSNGEPQQLSCIQQALLETLMMYKSKKADRDKSVQGILRLSAATCPKKLELLGDDKTLVLPQRAFSVQDPDFLALLNESRESQHANENNDDATSWTEPILTELYQQLARIHGSPRVARRGDIDPDSKVRASGHVLLWPSPKIPNATGPDSPGWITVTEHGIRQSFDLTRVMFSRGNVTEKMRFGKLVQPGETVLDLYAGIGYYTLPALKHGKARHVVACEWNPDAVLALEYNLKQNGLSDRATVLQGDCRVTMAAQEYKFDRISLGLLPSSEGGWKTAVGALRRDKGGWLHVHGNVPHKELRQWRLWLCHSLYALMDNSDWIVLNTNVERVKSFAPMISHYVADVFVGPPSGCERGADMGGHHAGVVDDKDSFVASDGVEAPSCALSSNGVLHQKWMMEAEEDAS